MKLGRTPMVEVRRVPSSNLGEFPRGLAAARVVTGFGIITVSGKKIKEFEEVNNSDSGKSSSRRLIRSLTRCFLVDTVS